MTNHANMMRHLLWKDAITIRSMMVAILVAIVTLNVAFGMFMWGEEGQSVDLFISIWILMPNLVALGAPALLIGSEEESGTLSWLRTLPVRWQQIADSKFIVSLVAVTAAWVVASIPMAAAGVSGRFTDTPISEAFFNIPGVLHLAFFSLLLLLCGFVTAYSFRSPVTALITVVPLIIFVNTLSLEVGSQVLYGGYRSADIPAGVGVWPWFTVAALATGTLVAFWFIQRLLARRRLDRPAGTTPISRIVAPSQTPYRPPAARMGLDRPSPVAALLWQQSQQLGLPGVLVVIVMVAFLIFRRTADLTSGTAGMEFLNAISPGMIALGASWLGSMAFYGDNVRRRCEFLSDRGISPNLIWWTRLLYPALLCGALLLLQLALTATTIVQRENPDGFVIAGIMVVMFAFGQLVALWMSRATLTFFAAPTYAMFILLGSYALIPGFDIDSASTLLFVPVLLFATWRLTPRWLSGRIDAGFHCRVIAYTLLAVLLPSLGTLAHRNLTMPREMTQWRAEMLALNVPIFDNHDAHEVFARAIINHRSGDAPKFDRQAFRKQVKQELASDRMLGAFVSRADIDVALMMAEDDDEIQRDAIAVLLKWASIVREEAAAGKQDLQNLEFLAELAEEDAVELLWSLTRRPGPGRADLVAQIPTAQLRKESRKVALINHWREIQRSRGDSVLLLESRLESRYLDQAIRIALEQLESGLPPTLSGGFREREKLREKARVHFGRLWTSDYEKRIDGLRSIYPSE